MVLLGPEEPFSTKYLLFLLGFSPEAEASKTLASQLVEYSDLSLVLWNLSLCGEKGNGGGRNLLFTAQISGFKVRLFLPTTGPSSESGFVSWKAAPGSPPALSLWDPAFCLLLTNIT